MELPVGSVEALARRLVRGDLVPETPLFDSGTGAWQEAAQSPVVRFILDEMERDGAELPPGWGSDTAQPSVPITVAPPPDAPTDESAPVVPDDPLDLKLTPTESPPGESVPRPDPVVEPEEPLPGSRHTLSPRRSRSERDDDEWVTPASEGGLLAEGPGRLEDSDDEPLEVADAIPESLRGRPMSWWEAALQGGWGRIAGFMLAGFTVIVGILFVGSWLGGGSRGSTVSLPASLESGVETELPTPPGLEAAVESGVALVSSSFVAAADSLRVARGLGRAPPESWLTGSYLANAGDFPEIRAYWEEYGGVIDDLRTSDRDVFTAALQRDLLTSDLSSERQELLLEYLGERYELTLPLRRETYAQLSSVASAAVGLHDFLVDQSDSILYTPAIGTDGVPRDPVLEVGTQSPAIQLELNARLDELFDALDRSRGGGAPLQTGLQEELFEGFGRY